MGSKIMSGDACCIEPVRIDRDFFERQWLGGWVKGFLLRQGYGGQGGKKLKWWLTMVSLAQAN